MNGQKSTLTFDTQDRQIVIRIPMGRRIARVIYRLYMMLHDERRRRNEDGLQTAYHRASSENNG